MTFATLKFPPRLPGLFIVVLLCDGVPQPFTYVPMIFIAVKAQIPKIQVFGVCVLWMPYSGKKEWWWEKEMEHFLFEV